MVFYVLNHNLVGLFFSQYMSATAFRDWKMDPIVIYIEFVWHNLQIRSFTLQMYSFLCAILANEHTISKIFGIRKYINLYTKFKFLSKLQKNMLCLLLPTTPSHSM